MDLSKLFEMKKLREEELEKIAAKAKTNEPTKEPKVIVNRGKTGK